MLDSNCEVLREVRAAMTVDECRSAVERTIRSLGFEFFAFGIRMPFPLTAPEFRIVSNYPAAWQEQYQAHGYLRVDPTVRHGLRSLSPMLWSQFSHPETMSFWDEAAAHDLRHGWAQPVRGMEGTIGMLTLARSRETILPSETADKLPMMTLVSVVVHDVVSRLFLSPTPTPEPQCTASFLRRGQPDTSMSRARRALLKSRHAPDNLENARVLTSAALSRVPTLTDREIEVLRWTAEGKVSVDISDILGITERTVNFHICNCMKKLGATSKTSAAVQAALWGLL
jgi:LuxR family transcriptional regulator